MICAAIDFGSNAIRIFIADVTMAKQYEVLVKYRYPVKIGSEVFKNQKVSENTIDEIVEVFRKFKSHFKSYKVESYLAVATSALRDAQNKDEIIEKIFKAAQIKLEVISGNQEAEYIYNLVSNSLTKTCDQFLFIDIGGGSTEVTVSRNDKVCFSKSYDSGTLRPSEVNIERVKNLNVELSMAIEKNKTLAVIGTGGNMRRLGKLKKKIYREGKGTEIDKNQVLEIKEKVKNLSPEQISAAYDLKIDRAQVIKEAINIFTNILSLYNPKYILLPKQGLGEAIIFHLMMKTA